MWAIGTRKQQAPAPARPVLDLSRQVEPMEQYSFLWLVIDPNLVDHRYRAGM